MTENHFKYWAFVSYCRLDNAEQRPDAPGVGHLCWGNWLLDTLKNFSTPPDFAGHLNARGEIVPERIEDIFSHEQDLSAGEKLSAEIRQALEQSRYLVVICSPRSAKSRAVDEAVRHFKKLGRGNRILSIVIAGQPHTQHANQPGLWLDDECFAPAMRYPLLPDGTLDENRLERGSIFADARHGDDKREILTKDFQAAESVLERAKIQLIAGLIGVGFNNLWQREQKRRFAGFAEAQSQIKEAWQLARKSQQEVAETQKRVEELQAAARIAEGKVVAAQQQLEEARAQVREAQKKILEVQNLAPDVKSQIQEAQERERKSQQQIQELKQQVREAESRLELARNQASEAERKLAEAENLARETRDQFQKKQTESRDVQDQVQASEKKIREAEQQAKNLRDEMEASRAQARDAQSQLQAAQEKSRAAQRLTKVFAVLAVLAALAAGVVWSQRKTISSDVAKPVSEPAQLSAATNSVLGMDQIQLALQNTNQAALDELAAQIPTEKISDTLDLAATILDDPHRSRFAGQLIAAWTQTNSVAAFDWAMRLTNAAHQQFAMEKILPALASEGSTNVLVAFDWLRGQTNFESLAGGAWRDAVISNFFRSWAAKDLDGATSAGELLTDASEKDIVGKILLAQRINVAPASAVAWMTNLPAGDARAQLMADLSESWAKTDATGALTWAQALPAKNERSNAVGKIVYTWAKYDFSAATNWIAAVTNDANKISAQLALAEPWAQLDARALATNAFTLPTGNVQTRWLKAATHQLATNDFASVVEVLHALPDAPLRQNLLEEAVQNSDPQKWGDTAKTIASMAGDGDQQAAIHGLLSRWTTSDPQSALDWLRAFPETNAQPQHLAAVLKTWAQSEPAAAAKWLASSASDATNEMFINALLDGSALKYPEFAAQWTQSVTNGPQREKFQVMVARRWLKTDYAAATKWIGTLNLPAEAKSAIDAP